jgi:DNA-binding MarR family transcriptional regulator
MARTPEPDPVEWVRERWAQQELPEPERFAAVASLLRAHQVVAAGLDAALRPHGLNRTTYLALVTLHLSQDGARSLGYLARHLMVHATTVTQLVDQAEGHGWVERRAHPTDRRTSLAVLLPAGRTLVREATAGAAAAGFGMDGVGPETLHALTVALRDVRRSVGDLPQD